MSAWAIRTGALNKQIRIAKAEGISGEGRSVYSPEAEATAQATRAGLNLLAMGGRPSWEPGPVHDPAPGVSSKRPDELAPPMKDVDPEALRREAEEKMAAAMATMKGTIDALAANLAKIVTAPVSKPDPKAKS